MSVTDMTAAAAHAFKAILVMMKDAWFRVSYNSNPLLCTLLASEPSAATSAMSVTDYDGSTSACFVEQIRSLQEMFISRLLHSLVVDNSHRLL